MVDWSPPPLGTRMVCRSPTAISIKGSTRTRAVSLAGRPLLQSAAPEARLSASPLRALRQTEMGPSGFEPIPVWVPPQAVADDEYETRRIPRLSAWVRTSGVRSLQLVVLGPNSSSGVSRIGPGILSSGVRRHPLGSSATRIPAEPSSERQKGLETQVSRSTWVRISGHEGLWRA